MQRPRTAAAAALAALMLVLSGCGQADPGATAAPATAGATGTAPPGATGTAPPASAGPTAGRASDPVGTPQAGSSATTPAGAVRVLGATPLPLRPDGLGQVLPTPPDLAERRLTGPDLLAPPAGGRFAATITEVPPEVLARSTWSPQCPVAVAELRYLTASFVGFDGRAHTGELLVNARVAREVVRVLGELFAAGFPIERMRVTSRAERDAPPTGDGNTTGGFVCRPAVGLSRWSAHAYGLAIDLDPFQNPYHHGDVVLPELASAYLDRARLRPGMIVDGGPVVAAFERIGWTWGGRWRSPVDLQHFSATGD